MCADGLMLVAVGLLVKSAHIDYGRFFEIGSFQKSSKNAAMKRISINTLADLRLNYIVWGHCNNVACIKNWQLDIEKMIEVLGPDFPIDGIRHRLSCVKCGGTDNRITLSAKNTGGKTFF